MIRVTPADVYVWCGWHQTKNCVRIAARKCFALVSCIECVAADGMSLAISAMILLVIVFLSRRVGVTTCCGWIEPRGLACECSGLLVWSVHDRVARRCYIPAGRCLLSMYCDVAILSVHVNSRRRSPFAAGDLRWWSMYVWVAGCCVTSMLLCSSGCCQVTISRGTSISNTANSFVWCLWLINRGLDKWQR